MRPKRRDFIFPLIFIIESLHIASKSISTVLIIYMPISRPNVSVSSKQFQELNQQTSTKLAL